MTGDRGTLNGRISIRPDDSGFKQHRHARTNGYQWTITLNGEPVLGCITADSEHGMVVRYKHDTAGALIWDKERQCLVDEVLHGKVEITYCPEVTL